VKLIVEREREIQNFKPKESWTIKANLSYNKEKFDTIIDKFENKKVKFTKEEDLTKVIA
jgi:DNA topoisomerase-1